jgi:hypothetical protein
MRAVVNTPKSNASTSVVDTEEPACFVEPVARGLVFSCGLAVITMRGARGPVGEPA